MGNGQWDIILVDLFGSSRGGHRADPYGVVGVEYIRSARCVPGTRMS